MLEGFGRPVARSSGPANAIPTPRICEGSNAASAKIADLGQPLYRKEEPTGYYDTADEWNNTAGMLGRMNFATALAANRLPGSKVNAASNAGLTLASPEFQRR